MTKTQSQIEWLIIFQKIQWFANRVFTFRNKDKKSMSHLKQFIFGGLEQKQKVDRVAIYENTKTKSNVKEIM